jgi:hypothetical protein
MGAIRSSETSVLTSATQHHIPEDGIPIDTDSQHRFQPRRDYSTVNSMLNAKQNSQLTTVPHFISSYIKRTSRIEA